MTLTPAAGAFHVQSPDERLGPQDIQAMLAAAASERDRLLLRTLWATGARLGEVLALRPRDIRRPGLLLPNPRDRGGPGKLAELAQEHARLPTELRRWARAHALAPDEPLFFSRERGEDGQRKAIDRVRAWQIITLTARRARGADQEAGRPRSAARRTSARNPVDSRPPAPPEPDPPTSWSSRSRRRCFGWRPSAR